MLDTILRMIYRRFKTRFQDYLVEEYLDKIPNRVKQDGFEVFHRYKRKFQKLNNYFAYHLHRRMANDPRNSERYQGMFVQLKMYDQIIQGRPDPDEEVKDVAAAKHFNYDNAIEKAQGFAAKAKQHNTQTDV